MQYLDQPVYKKEGNVYVLYKADFSTGEPGFSPHTSVAGGGFEVGRYASLQELQETSRRLYGQEAQEAAD